MRPASILRPAPWRAVLLASLVFAASPAGARPPARRPTPPASEAHPRRDAPTTDSVVTLRTPGSDAVLVRGGTFYMGSTDHEVMEVALALCKREPASEDCTDQMFSNEQTLHDVLLSDFWIDRTEVTVARYRQCVAAGRCSEPPYASGGARFDRPELPVSLVTWQDASNFCQWAGGRLPTEAEWEGAARGRSSERVAGRRYPWGNSWNPNLANRGHAGVLPQGVVLLALDPYESRDGYVELAPVGSYADGRTPDGLDDLAGNVEEWVGDFYAPEYPKASQVNPRGPDVGEERVLRGGSYFHGAPWLRSASRSKDVPNQRRTWRGFRCVRPA